MFARLQSDFHILICLVLANRSCLICVLLLYWAYLLLLWDCWPLLRARLPWEQALDSSRWTCRYIRCIQFSKGANSNRFRRHMPSCPQLFAHFRHHPGQITFDTSYFEGPWEVQMWDMHQNWHFGGWCRSYWSWEPLQVIDWCSLELYLLSLLDLHQASLVAVSWHTFELYCTICGCDWISPSQSWRNRPFRSSSLNFG